MSDRRVAAPGTPQLEAWMRRVDADLTMLKRRKLQGDLSMQSAALSESMTIAGDLSAAGACTFEGIPFDRSGGGLLTLQQFSTADVAITTVSANVTDIPGAVIPLTVTGRYLILAQWDISISVGSGGGADNVQAWIRGTDGVSDPVAAGRALASTTVAARLTMNAYQYVRCSGLGGTVKLQATKGQAAGTVTCVFGASCTQLMAIRTGP